MTSWYVSSFIKLLSLLYPYSHLRYHGRRSPAVAHPSTSQPSLTHSGHILCSKCLFSCLLAAIARNPNPHPMNQPRPKPRPKSRKKKTARNKKEAQPVEWTAEELQETWRLNRDIEYESIAKEAGLDAIDMEAGRDTSEVPVEMILKGLWRVDGEVVVEGECPVCSILATLMRCEHG